jgi:hypothetical protein
MLGEGKQASSFELKLSKISWSRNGGFWNTLENFKFWNRASSRFQFVKLCRFPSVPVLYYDTRLTTVCSVTCTTEKPNRKNTKRDNINHCFSQDSLLHHRVTFTFAKEGRSWVQLVPWVWPREREGLSLHPIAHFKHHTTNTISASQQHSGRPLLLQHIVSRS